MRSLGQWVRLSLALTLLLIWALVEHDLFHHDWGYIVTLYLGVGGGIVLGVPLGLRFHRSRRRHRQQPTAAQHHPEVEQHDASGG
jgi:hypothetical protein